MVTHAFALAGAVSAALLARAFPERWLLFVLAAFWFGPGGFCNALFHVGASIASRSYCPGAVTGLLVYLPLSLWLGALALREGLIGLPALCVALGIAAAFHTLEVGRNVFARW